MLIYRKKVQQLEREVLNAWFEGNMHRVYALQDDITRYMMIDLIVIAAGVLLVAVLFLVV